MLFKDIIGHSNIINLLIETVKNNRISHAQLFSGSTGTGALSVAIAYCQYISCTDKKENDSCGVCPSCKKFKKLVHPDLHFVFPVCSTSIKKPSSNDFIKEWRELLIEKNSYIDIEQWITKIDSGNKQPIINNEQSKEVIQIVSKKPFEAEYKFILIWQSERMNKEFANKILKELEEPAQKTLFILISENSGKLLPTIISRCQLLNFPKIENSIIQTYIKNKYNFDDNKSNKIAKIINGNIIKLNETINNNNDDSDYFSNFAKFMRICYQANKNLTQILELVEILSRKGREYQKHFLDYALYLIRENFMLNIRQDSLSYMFDNEHEFSNKFALFIRETNVFEFYEEITKAKLHIERNVNPKIVFFDLAMKFSIIFAKTKKIVLS